MITDAILNMTREFIGVLISAVPSVDVGWSNVDLSMLGFANAFFPIAEMMAFLRVMVGVTAGALVLWGVKKVIDWLPFT